MQISLLGLNFSLTNTHIQHPFSTPANQTEPNYLLIVGYSCWKRLIIYQRIIQVDQDYWVAVLGQICLPSHRTDVKIDLCHLNQSFDFALCQESYESVLFPI
jgi:hypothetical protein